MCTVFDIHANSSCFFFTLAQITQTNNAASMLASAFSNWWSPLHTGVKSDLHITPENGQDDSLGEKQLAIISAA